MAFTNAMGVPGLGSGFQPGVASYLPMLDSAALGRLGGLGLDPNAALGQMEAACMQTLMLDAMVLQLLRGLMQNQGNLNSGQSSSGDSSGSGGSTDSSGGSTDSSGGSGTTDSSGGTTASGSGGNGSDSGGTAGGASGPLSSGTPIPSKNGFAEALLRKIGAPVTPENIRFLDAWQKAEGGSADNPFNTTENAPGARCFNSCGVKRYPSVEEGLNATAQTLLNGKYGNIVAALRQGGSAKSCAAALANSPWGTGALVEKIIG